MRKLTDKEKRERLLFVQTEIKKRYGAIQGSLAKAAEGLGVNYSALSNMLHGRLQPSSRLLEALGYEEPPFTTPLGKTLPDGRQCTYPGAVFEVELDEHAAYLRNRLVDPSLAAYNGLAHWNYAKQEAAIMSHLISNLMRSIADNPAKYGFVADESKRYKAPAVATAALDTSKLTADEYEADLAGDSIMDMDIMG